MKRFMVDLLFVHRSSFIVGRALLGNPTTMLRMVPRPFQGTDSPSDGALHSALFLFPLPLFLVMLHMVLIVIIVIVIAVSVAFVLLGNAV